jgi:PIN domain nuclease of toxin-antitoxin system
LLVDTRIVLWARITPERLTPGERQALDSAETRYVSAITFWEIAILVGLGRIAPDDRLFAVPEGFDLLPVLPAHCAELVRLPRRHRDPFDRMLIAQARAERLALLTRDHAIIGYGAEGAEIISPG